MSETLYRFFDKDHNLLYVGISNSWHQRLRQHYKDSDFYSEAVVMTMEHYKTREEVELAEKQAIESESPKYNKALNPNFETAPIHINKIKAWTYSNIEPDFEHRDIVKELKRLFIEDPLWTRKSAGPIAYYLQEYLPDWSRQFGVKCEMCVNAWDSQQIQSWAEETRKKHNATH